MAITTPEAAPTSLGYGINDADQHTTPAEYAYEKYIDPKLREKAIRLVTDENGRQQRFYAGRPQKLQSKNNQVTFSEDLLAEVGVHGRGTEDESNTGAAVPGSLLNKLNPLKEFDVEGRKEFAKAYRAMQAQMDDPTARLSVMDFQGVEAAVNYAGPLGIEYDLDHDVEALYANIRAVNRYLQQEWGYTTQNRLFTPPFISLADPELALKELEAVIAEGAPKVVQIGTGPAITRSPFAPENDPFWSRMNDEGINFCTHLATVTHYGKQGIPWSEEEAILGDMDAFQWVFYYGDRPAMEVVGAAILQGLFARFPNVKLLLSEQGTLWVPYLVRKMDHAFMMGRRGTFAKLTKRPSQYFREHVKVAPYPEENVDRVAEAVGVDPIVFGSDFPHGEGLPDPMLYMSQLKNFNEEDKRKIMRGNLAGFLGLPD